MIDFGALNRLGRDIRKKFEPKIDKKLRNREVHLISLIKKHPEEPFVFYSERLGLERSSFSYLAEMLELKGLIKRKNSDKDKRTKILVLTEEGCNLADEIEKQFQEYLVDLLKKLSKSEYKKLDSAVELVKKMMDKILI